MSKQEEKENFADNILKFITGNVAKYGLLVFVIYCLYIGVKKTFWFFLMPILLLVSIKALFDANEIIHGLNTTHIVCMWIFSVSFLSKLFVIKKV